jgi:hypothetical protein
MSKSCLVKCHFVQCQIHSNDIFFHKLHCDLHLYAWRYWCPIGISYWHISCYNTYTWKAINMALQVLLFCKYCTLILFSSQPTLNLLFANHHTIYQENWPISAPCSSTITDIWTSILFDTLSLLYICEERKSYPRFCSCSSVCMHTCVPFHLHTSQSTQGFTQYPV